MSLKPGPIQPVPEETVRVARVAFRKGNPLLKLRDELGTIFREEDFADLFPRLGQPAGASAVATSATAIPKAVVPKAIAVPAAEQPKPRPASPKPTPVPVSGT